MIIMQMGIHIYSVVGMRNSPPGMAQSKSFGPPTCLDKLKSILSWQNSLSLPNVKEYPCFQKREESSIAPVSCIFFEMGESYNYKLKWIVCRRASVSLGLQFREMVSQLWRGKSRGFLRMTAKGFLRRCGVTPWCGLTLGILLRQVTSMPK